MYFGYFTRRGGGAGGIRASCTWVKRFSKTTSPPDFIKAPATKAKYQQHWHLFEPQEVFCVVQPRALEPLRDLVHGEGLVDHLRRFGGVDDGEIIPQDPPKLDKEMESLSHKLPR
jgi:hypothetical protein